jgi:hypothetical protein
MEHAMNEADFDRLIDAVRNAVVVSSAEGPLASAQSVKAANDNLAASWQTMSFPGDWYVA